MPKVLFSLFQYPLHFLHQTSGLYTQTGQHNPEHKSIKTVAINMKMAMYQVKNCHANDLTYYIENNWIIPVIPSSYNRKLSQTVCFSSFKNLPNPEEDIVYIYK